jgi:hypothetical protein
MSKFSDINSNIAIIFEVQLSEVFTLLTDSSFFPVKINVKNMIISKIIFLSINKTKSGNTGLIKNKKLEM